MNRHAIVGLLAFAALVARPLPGHGWVKSVCSGTGEELDWDNATAAMRYSSVSFPVGNSFRDSLTVAIDHWNESPSAFDFTKIFGDTNVKLSNGESEVWFTSDAAYDPAMTITYYKGLTFCSNPRIDEADVLFYGNEDYTTSMSTTNLWNYGETGHRPFEATAMHELGHALGLEHENDEYNIMGEDWTHLSANLGTARSYAGEDASDGAIDLYGSVAVQDMGVVHWKRVGADGGYSDHAHTKLWDATGLTILPWVEDGDWRQYTVSPGDTIQIELSYENNGRDDQTVDVGFYLSTNNYITTFDERLGGFTPILGRGDVFTTKKTVTIPADTGLGEYWIGAVIDEDDVLAEVTETNNATWIHVSVE